MANQDYLHTVEIMKASLPYFDSATRVRLEFFSKVLDLMGNLSAMTGRNSMVACGYESTSIDMEGLLNGIRPLCNSRERDFVDRILNIFNMKRMFEMYNNMMSTMNAMQGFGGFSFNDESPKDDTDTVTGNFTGSNFESIFQDSASEAFDPMEAFSEHIQEDHPNKSNSFSPDNSMFEMLKTMVPPEQVSTFENLRMLLSTMSYDGNSKSDDSKEHDHG